MSDPLIESILDSYRSGIVGEVVARAVASDNIELVRVAQIEIESLRRELAHEQETSRYLQRELNKAKALIQEREDEEAEKLEDYTAEDERRDHAVRMAEFK